MPGALSRQKGSQEATVDISPCSWGGGVRGRISKEKGKKKKFRFIEVEEITQFSPV